MSARTLAAALLLALGACRADADPRTEILLVVDSDLSVPEQLDRLEIYVEGPGELAQTAVAELGTEGAALPRSVALLHQGGPLGPLHATVEGKRAGQRVLGREARLSFVAGRTLVLPMHLAASCAGRACGAETCTERGCESVDIDPSTLAPYAGDEPALPRLDGGARELDAGAAFDAGTAEADAGAHDAGSGREGGLTSDAATEAGAEGGTQDAGACSPVTEQCNGRDDDCDGRSDETFDLQSDPDHCGTCATRCTGAARRCCIGECQSACR